MELRNIRRSYMINKGLRIFRKRTGSTITPTQLRYLSCMLFNKRSFAASTIRDIMCRDGHSVHSVQTVYPVMDELHRLNMVECNNGLYKLSSAGYSAMCDIEKCIRDARPDR